LNAGFGGLRNLPAKVRGKNGAHASEQGLNLGLQLIKKAQIDSALEITDFGWNEKRGILK
jgi:hypothetical protein